MSFFNLFKKGRQQNKPKYKNFVNKNDDGVISVDKRIKGIKPNKYGLYPHEVLVLSYAPRYELNNNSFQSSWWYKYGIKDVNKILIMLRNKGFIKVCSLKTAIANETTSVLKHFLRDNNLKLSGKKDELVERLIDEVSYDKLSSTFTKYTYELTSTGLEVLNDEDYIPYIHRHDIEGLDIWSLGEMVKIKKPVFSFKDVIW